MHVCVYVEARVKHKREANLSDLIRPLAVLPLTYSKETNSASMFAELQICP